MSLESLKRSADTPLGDDSGADPRGRFVREAVAACLARPFETMVVVVLAGFVVFSYPQASEILTPSTALTWFVAPLAVLALAARALERDRAALIAAVLACWCVLTSLVSAAPWNSLIGGIGRHSSALVFVTGLGAWALAASLSVGAKRTLCWAVVVAAGASGCVGVLQMILKPTGGFLAYAFGRPSGFAINPVYFAAHVGAAAGFFAYRFARSQRFSELIGFGAFSMLTALAGSRVAIAPVVAVAVAAPFVARTARSVSTIPVVFASVWCAQLIHTATGSSQSAADRTNLDGLDLRFEVWSFGVRAWLDKPITGYGLGRFRGASQRYYSDDWVRLTGDDYANAFLESHNLIVQVMVSLGAVGLVLLLAFLGTALIRARGPATWMAAVMFATWLMQPAVAQTWPVGLALLGAAALPLSTTATIPTAQWRRASFAVAIGIGLFLGGSMVLADQRIVGIADGERMNLPSSMWILKRDPVLASSMAEGGFDATQDDPGPADYVLTWTERAAEYDADFPLWWAQLGLRRLRYDDVDGAREAAERGVELQPNHPTSWQVLLIVAERTDDQDLLARADEMLCRLDLGSCAGAASD